MERKEFNSLNEAALQVQLGESSSRGRKKDTRGKKRQLGLPVSGLGGIGGEPDNLDGDAWDLHTSRQEEKAREAQFARKKELTRKKLFGKQGANPLKAHVEYDEVEPMVLEYFNNYFGDNLNENTSDEDIMEAVYDLIDLTEVVLSSVGLQEVGQHLPWHMRAKFPPKMDHTMDDARKSRWKYLGREKKRTAGTQVVTTADGRIKRIKNRNRGPGETTIKGSWRDRKGDVGVPPKPETKHPSQTAKPPAKPPAMPPRPAPKPETFRGRTIPPKTFSSKPKLAPKILQQGTKGKPVLQQGTKGKPGYIKLTPKNK